MSNKVCWVIKRDSDGRVLLNNGRWSMHADPRKFKWYHTEGGARRRMGKLNKEADVWHPEPSPFSAHAVGPGDTIDAAGNITRATTEQRLDAQENNRTARYSELLAGSDGRSERMDCSVVAVAAACNLTYAYAHDVLSRMGRRDGRRTPRHLTEDAVNYCGFKAVRLPTSMLPKTVNRCPSELPSDRVYLVFVSGHVLCVRDGDTHDWTRGRRHKPSTIWEIVQK